MKIRINDCKDPKSCIECVQICPMSVIVLKPVGAKKMSAYVERWKIAAIFKDLCNGCMKCVEICPENCIKIEL